MAFQPPAPPALTTADDATSYVQQVDLEIGTLQLDVDRGATLLPPTALQQYDLWIRAWIDFRTAVYGSTILNPWRTWDQAAQYEVQNEDWRSTFAGFGLKSTSPKAHDRPDDGPAVSTGTKVLVGLGLMATIAIIWKVA